MRSLDAASGYTKPNNFCLGNLQNKLYNQRNYHQTINVWASLLASSEPRMCDSLARQTLPKISACVIQNFLDGTVLQIWTTLLGLQLKLKSVTLHHRHVTEMTYEKSLLFVWYNLHKCDTTGPYMLLIPSMLAPVWAHFTRTGASTHADQHFSIALPTTVNVTVFVFYNTPTKTWCIHWNALWLPAWKWWGESCGYWKLTTVLNGNYSVMVLLSNLNFKYWNANPFITTEHLSFWVQTADMFHSEHVETLHIFTF